MAENNNSTNQILDVSRSMGDIMSQVKGKFSGKGSKTLGDPKISGSLGGIVDPLKSLGAVLNKPGSSSGKVASPNKKVDVLNFDVVNKALGKGVPIEGALEEGGEVKEPGNYLVGEDGPEVVNLPEGSSVIPLDVEDLIEGLSRVSEIKKSIVDNKINVDTKNRLIKTDLGDFSVDMLVKNYSAEIQEDRALGMNTDQSVLALSSLQKLSEKISSPSAELPATPSESKDKTEPTKLYKEAEKKEKEERTGKEKTKTAEEKLTNKSGEKKTGKGVGEGEEEYMGGEASAKKTKTAEQNLLSKTKGPTPAEIEAERKRLIEEDPEWYGNPENLEEEIDYFVNSYAQDLDSAKKTQIKPGEEKIEKSKSVEDSPKLLEKSKPILLEQELVEKKSTGIKKETPNKTSEEEKTRKRVESAKEKEERRNERKAKRKKSEAESEVINPGDNKIKKDKLRNKSALLDKLSSNLKNEKKRVGRLDLNKIRDLISGKSPIKGALKLGGEVQDPGNYLVGENGPEIVNLPARTSSVSVDVSDLVEGLSKVSEISKYIVGEKLEVNPSNRTIETESGNISLNALEREYLSKFTVDKSRESALIVSSLQKLSNRISSIPAPDTSLAQPKKEEAFLSESKSEASGEKVQKGGKKEADAKTAEQNLLSKNKLGLFKKGSEEKKAGAEDKNELLKPQSQTVEQKLSTKAKGPTAAEIEAEKKRLIEEDPDFYSDPKNMEDEIKSFIESYDFTPESAKNLLTLSTKEKATEPPKSEDLSKKSKSAGESSSLSEKIKSGLLEKNPLKKLGANLEGKEDKKGKPAGEKKGILDKLLTKKKPEPVESKSPAAGTKEAKSGAPDNKKGAFAAKGEKLGILDKIKEKTKDVFPGKPGPFKESSEGKLSSKIPGIKDGLFDNKKGGEKSGSLVKGGLSPLKQTISPEKMIPAAKGINTKEIGDGLLGGSKSKIEKSVSSLSLRSPDNRQTEKPKESSKPSSDSSKSSYASTPPKETKEEKPSPKETKIKEKADSKSGTSESSGSGNMDDIKGLLSQIAISLSSPVTFYNPDPFRPDSRRI
jgi:hypothetical protein